MIELSIVTPTYNRADLLPRCYHSLREQTRQDFEWIVIDDGSTDHTKDLIESYINCDDNLFPIYYQYKPNGGKHTALNASHELIHGKYVVILDSDDYLTPDAVETICREWGVFYLDKSICCLSFYKALENGKTVSKEIDGRIISDHISFRVNQTSGGDQCEVVRAEYFKEYTFPVFSGERFISEGLLWNYLGFRYKTVYCNKAVYICEYRSDGISKSGRKLLMRNPKGMIELTKTFFDSRVCFRKRIKETWLYIVYSLCDKRSFKRIVKESKYRFLTFVNYPIGAVLYSFWKQR